MIVRIYVKLIDTIVRLFGGQGFQMDVEAETLKLRQALHFAWFGEEMTEQEGTE